MRYSFLALVGAAALLFCLSTQAAGTAEAAYAKGIAAFQSADYHQALEDFLQARAAGLHSTQLGYSLGATYYRLGQYAPAKREFESLQQDTRLAALVHYNLGLIASAQGSNATALDEYRRAYAEAAQPDIRRLAAAEISRLTPHRVSTWIGYTQLSTGYDDNVAFAPESGVTGPAHQGSGLISILAGGAGQLTGTYADGLRVFGSYYRADYPRLSLYDQTLMNLGTQYRRTVAGWSLQARLSGGAATLGGADFETLGTLRFALDHRLAASQQLAVGYQYQRVHAAAAYDYLGGWQQQLFIEDQITGSGYQAVIGYRHESNQRNDLTLGGEFLSASPIRNRVYAHVTWRPGGAWSWNLALICEKSLYGKPDVLESGSGTTALTRADTLYIGNIGAEYSLAESWRLGIAYRYLRNASNLSIYSYRSNRYSISLEYLFF